jgi:hypothetical protein
MGEDDGPVRRKERRPRRAEARISSTPERIAVDLHATVDLSGSGRRARQIAKF